MDVFHTKIKPCNPEKTMEENDETEKKRDALIKDFGSYTTLHGFHFLLDSASWPRRLLWMTLLLFGVTLLTYQLVASFNKLYDNQSILTKGVERPKEVYFPAVTICNQNMMRKSKIQGTQAQRYLDQLDKIKLQLGTKLTNESFDTEMSVRENGHNISDMLMECSFMGKRCSTKDFTMQHTSYSRGLCYTFNSGKNGTLPARVTTSGVRQSLNLRLDAQPEEYYGPFSYDATGFKIAVHDQKDHPDMDEKAFDLSPGFFTNIRVRREKDINLRSPFLSNCGTRNLSNSDEYSMSACLYECYSKLLADKCHCRVLSMAPKGLNVTRFCTTGEIWSCIINTYLELNPALCDCPKPCQAIHYKLQLSTAYFPSDHLWDALLPVIANTSLKLLFNTTGKSQEEILQKTQEVVRRRVSQVQIFYETLLTDVLEEKPAYGISDFGSDFGGNMGLFLGCSLLTICEFIDLIIMLCILRCRRWKSRNREFSTSQE